MGKFDYLKKPHADTAGRDRTIRIFEQIEAEFPEWDDCKIAEGYRGWLDDNGIEAESDTGWIHEEAAVPEVIQLFIAAQQVRDAS